MIRNIITYPDPTINQVSPDVRDFDESLITLIDDMKETMEHHHVSGLAAIQIGVALSVVVIKKDDGSYLEMINPRILNKKGTVTSKEQTLYLPDVERNIERYDQISLIYQDVHGEQCSLKADGPLSLLIQRKFDYVFGGSFVNKMHPKARKELEKELAYAGKVGTFESMGPISKREYFKSFMTKLLVVEGLMVIAGFFDLEAATRASLYSYTIFISVALLILNASYYMYALYESKRVISCTGCQVVNFLSVSLQYLTVTIIVFVASYFTLGSA